MKKISLKSIYLIASSLLLFSISSSAQYCIPTSGSGCDLGDNINSFTLNGEGGTSISTLNTGCAIDAYSDLTCSSSS